MNVDTINFLQTNKVAAGMYLFINRSRITLDRNVWVCWESIAAVIKASTPIEWIWVKNLQIEIEPEPLFVLKTLAQTQFLI